MIKLYNSNGDFCLCNPDQVDSMKSIGYTLDTNPIKEVVIPEVIETIEPVIVAKETKKKKDIIL